MFFSFEIIKTIELSVLLLFCLFICLLIFVRGDACFKERAHVWVGRGSLSWASGYSFPLFLVYPVDMPDTCWYLGAVTLIPHHLFFPSCPFVLGPNRDVHEFGPWLHGLCSFFLDFICLLTQNVKLIHFICRWCIPTLWPTSYQCKFQYWFMKKNKVIKKGSNRRFFCPFMGEWWAIIDQAHN